MGRRENRRKRVIKLYRSAATDQDEAETKAFTAVMAVIATFFVVTFAVGAGIGYAIFHTWEAALFGGIIGFVVSVGGI